MLFHFATIMHGRHTLSLVPPVRTTTLQVNLQVNLEKQYAEKSTGN